MKIKNLVCKPILSVFTVMFFTHFAFGAIVVLNGLTHENTTAPGENYRGKIKIQNTGDTEKSVRVYLKDYTYNYTGESRHDEPGTMERSNAGWVTFNPELANLSPGEKADIEYEIKVPLVDSLKGTYWSVIMVEGLVPPDTTTQKRGITINTAIRYAVQIISHIGVTGISDLQFIGLEMDKADSIDMLNVIIENTGERQLRPEMALELFDGEGNSAGIIKTKRRKTLPGTSIKTQIRLEGIKPGKYTGVLVADCDEDHVFGTNVSFEIE